MIKWDVIAVLVCPTSEWHGNQLDTENRNQRETSNIELEKRGSIQSSSYDARDVLISTVILIIVCSATIALSLFRFAIFPLTHLHQFVFRNQSMASTALALFTILLKTMSSLHCNGDSIALVNEVLRHNYAVILVSPLARGLVCVGVSRIVFPLRSSQSIVGTDCCYNVICVLCWRYTVVLPHCIVLHNVLYVSTNTPLRHFGPAHQSCNGKPCEHWHPIDEQRQYNVCFHFQ